MDEEKIIAGRGSTDDAGRTSAGVDPLDQNRLGISGSDHLVFSLSHRHSGLQGDGRKIPVGSLDTSIPFAAGDGPVFTVASGNRYRLTVVEVTGEDGSLSGAIELVPVS